VGSAAILHVGIISPHPSYVLDGNSPFPSWRKLLVLSRIIPSQTLLRKMADCMVGPVVCKALWKKQRGTGCRKKRKRAERSSQRESLGARRSRRLYLGREKTAKETKRRHNGGQADNAWWLRTRLDSGVSRSRRGGAWTSAGGWFAKSTQGLLRI